MEITYTWTITALEAVRLEGHMPDVIKSIHWRYSATNEYGGIVDISSKQFVPSPDPNNFIPYFNITFETVISWLEQMLDVESMKLSLEKDLNNQEVPTGYKLPIPWEISNNIEQEQEQQEQNDVVGGDTNNLTE